MKHHLSSFRRSTALRVFCILILAVMCAPMAMAASITPGMPTLAVGGFNPLMAAGAVGGLAGLGLMAAANKEGQENGGGGPGANAEEESIDPAAAIAKIEERTLTMSQRLAVAAKALRGIPPAAQFTKVQDDLTTANTELTKVRGELESANKRVAALEADVTGLEQSNARLEQDKKDLEAKEQDISKRASEQAKSIARGVGIEANKLPAAQAGDETQVTAEDRIKALTGNRRTEAALYYRQHKKLPEWMN